MSLTEHNITDTSLPVEQVEVQPISPDKPDLESTQIEKNVQPQVDIRNETEKVMSEDSIEAENDVTFDKSDTSVTDNVPVISSKYGADQNLSTKDAVTNDQLETVEMRSEDNVSKVPNSVKETLEQERDNPDSVSCNLLSD